MFSAISQLIGLDDRVQVGEVGLCEVDCLIAFGEDDSQLVFCLLCDALKIVTHVSCCSPFLDRGVKGAIRNQSLIAVQSESDAGHGCKDTVSCR